MARKSIESLLATPFEGRVVSQLDDPLGKYSDFEGNPTIVYPWSDQGLRHAVKLKESYGRKGFLRSGLSSSGDGGHDGGGALVVDLSCFTGIEVRGPNRDKGKTITITVEAAVNTRQLANELIRANAFLPLGDNPVKSVVSSVLSGNPGYFDRSMGSLRDYVEEFEVITSQGDVAHVKKGEDEFHSILDGTFGGAIKAIAFSAMTSSKAVKVMRASFVYAKEDLDAAIALLNHQRISETMDISVHAYHHAYGVGIVSVTMAGKSGDHGHMKAVLGQMGTEKHLHRVEASSPAEIVELILEGGLSGNPYVDRNLVCKHYYKLVELKDFDSFKTSFVNDMATALRDKSGGYRPQVVGSVRLSRDNEKNLAVSADVFSPKVQRNAEIQFNRVARRSLGQPVKSKPHVAARKRALRKRTVYVDLSELRSVARPADARTIPGFGGQIYAPGDPDYDKMRHQYASSSYPDKQGPGGSMHPYMVAYPRKDTDDIAVAIKYAVTNKKYVVARSGGHQYCGLSSGGDDTILLSMDLCNDLEVTEVNGKMHARVGVGRLLTDIAAEFKRNGVTIPHGECPRVAIGGHVQTGGYGHLLRSYGLALDHVYQFKIYLHDGTLQIVSRPQAKDENSLFWGVLGGGPGSFGILTEITFECIRDTDHQYSGGYAGTFLYDKRLFHDAMQEIQRWTAMVASGVGLPPDVDMCMTVASDKVLGYPVYLLEMVNGNKDGGDDGGSNDEFLARARRNIVGGTWRKIPCKGFEGKRPISYMADFFVRREGTTADGREFPEPYQKRLNCTKLALNDTFVEDFVDLVDRVVTSSTVLLCFQMFIGGGAYARPQPYPPLSSICHRDVTLGIVFDCFYRQGGLEDAKGFQKYMQSLLENFSGEQEVRMLWGSFGDTNIGDASVRKCYYDDVTWQSLQKLKKRADGGDLFHTEFTVQLP